MLRSIAIASVLLSLTAANALAHSNKYSVDDRQASQNQQIENGRLEGSITWREGLKLRAEQRAIANREAELASDGKLSRGDRHELKKLQNELADDIVDRRQNGPNRPSWLPRVGR